MKKLFFKTFHALLAVALLLTGLSSCRSKKSATRQQENYRPAPPEVKVMYGPPPATFQKKIEMPR